MTDLERWADKSMFRAEPMKSTVPQVHLLNMTADPLGAIAAACRIYEGKATYNLEEVTDEERLHYWKQVQATHLRAPLEFVDLHFFLEGVDRAFTHQLVRQRTAVYAQESMRFAVKDNMAAETSLPPSLAANDQLSQVWKSVLGDIQDAYNFLVANGIPAEDARGLLPHCTTTRIHFKTNLRNLVDHAGNRLCTQAQYHWRSVFAGVVNSIRNHGRYLDDPSEMQPPPEAPNEWQFETIANSMLFRPVCYQMGKCPFKADFDRGCTIRGRVDAFADDGTPSTKWGIDATDEERKGLAPIRESEWLLDPRAAWQ